MPAAATYWFDHPDAPGGAPALFRLYIYYCRLAVDRATGRVRGESYLRRLIRRLTIRLGLGRDVRVHVNGVCLVLDLCDLRMLWAIEEARGTNDDARVIGACLEAGDTFVDAGANLGGYTVFATTIAGPAGAVIAFEPQPRLAALIRKSFDANRYASGTVHEIACSDRAGAAELLVPSWSGAAGLYPSFSGRTPHDRVTVRTATLDALLDGARLPGRLLLKIDVEGSELAVLRGAERLIRERRPAILFELNPASARAAGHTAEDVLAFLVTLGYEEFSDVTSYPAVMSAAAVNCTRERNLLALPPSPPSRASSPATRSSTAAG